MKPMHSLRLHIAGRARKERELLGCDERNAEERHRHSSQDEPTMINRKGKERKGKERKQNIHRTHEMNSQKRDERKDKKAQNSFLILTAMRHRRH